MKYNRYNPLTTTTTTIISTQHHYHHHLIALHSQGNIMDIDLTVRILTTGNWPTHAKCDVTIPHDAYFAYSAFKTFVTPT